MIKQNQSGHTLAELLISMTLTLLIFAALIPLHSLGLKSLYQQQATHVLINKAQNLVKRLERDLSQAGASGCLINKNSLYNDQGNKKPPTSLASFNHKINHWYPAPPSYYKSINNALGDALNITFADLHNPIEAAALAGVAMGIYYVTNCTFAEIISLNNNQSKLIPQHHPGSIFVFPYQSITYQLRQQNTTKTLYRQYITSTEKLRNEPLADGIQTLHFGFAEKQAHNSVMFKSAQNIINWNQVVAVYVQFAIEFADRSFVVKKIIVLENHAKQ